MATIGRGEGGTLSQDSLPGAYPQAGLITSNLTSLARAVHSRQAEYVRPQRIRIKVGSWNVAALPGTEKDIGGWFVQGKGVSESLANLKVNSPEEPHMPCQEALNPSAGKVRESVVDQESRASKKQSTIPQNDKGTLPGGEDIGLYVLGLQEIVDISSATEALRPYHDSSVTQKWKKALSDALPQGYMLVTEQHFHGLYLLIYAAPSVAQSISSVSASSVGTGIMGYMGNKGGVTVRFLLGETTRLVFVNCHLAAGTEKNSLERRNWDAAQIVARTKYDAIDDGSSAKEESGEVIGDEDFAWWFGDLNYRLTGLPSEDVRRLLMLHTRNEYDLGQRSSRKIENELAKTEGSIVPSANAEHHNQTDRSALIPPTGGAVIESASDMISSTSSTANSQTDGNELDPYSDPTSLQTTISSLLPHDELRQQQKAGHVFHDGWREGPITFLPTYKYDIGSVGVFDSSEKKRNPSWCDRILFRSKSDRDAYYQLRQEEAAARRKDAEMKASGIAKAAAEDEAVLFDYNPEYDGMAYVEDDDDDTNDGLEGGEPVVTKAGVVDRLQLDVYTSHQRVLSSDHKPLVAIFTLQYDGAVPELKAKVHQEVARELDRAENDARPDVTVVVDHRPDDEEGYSTPLNAAKLEDSNVVNFGEVRYGQSKLRTITIANTSQVASDFSFSEKALQDGTMAIVPPWLKLRLDNTDDPDKPVERFSTSPKLHLEPGEAISVVLELRVEDVAHVRDLNSGKAKLEDFLILHVSHGRDHFIPVHGKWMPSAFGRSVDELIRVPEDGVRSIPVDSNKDCDNNVKWSAPRELFRLTELIEELVERVIAEVGMTAHDPAVKAPWEVKTGWPFDSSAISEEDPELDDFCTSIREYLDTAKVIPQAPSTVQANVYLMAASRVLVDFLRSLSDGIIPESLWNILDQSMKDLDGTSHTPEDERQAILDVLSAAPNYNVSFVLLTSMLSRIAGEVAPVHDTQSAHNTLNLPLERIVRRAAVNAALAGVFAKVMIRSNTPSKEKEKKALEDRKRGVIEVFLVTSSS
ncbi:MAG: hypothetical protein M1824_005505 [Vezdaea acicularis]|nr:MAG: hypothetical protein M1824_005505 [Vezdaea acicularis]